MRLGTALLLATFVVLLVAPEVNGQAFEKPSILIEGGVGLPVGTFSDDYSVGPLLRLSARLPLGTGIALGPEVGAVFPNGSETALGLTQYPVGVLLIFPLASEGSSTPYLAVGPAVTFSSVDAPVGLDANIDPLFTPVVKLGWAYRPEHLTRTMFDIGVRYDHQFLGHAPNWSLIGLSVGFALVF